MKKILFFAAAATLMMAGCTKENPAPAGTDSQTPSGQEGEGKEDEKPEKTLTGYRAAYTYYVADEALDLSVVGAPKKLVAVYSDNSTAAVSDASAFTFSDNAQIAASEGDQTFSATYKGETVSVTIPVKKGSEGFGAPSLTTTEWAWASENVVGQLGIGGTATLKMFVYSSCANNYSAPCVQLCNGDWSSNFVSLRMDNWGWDPSWAACTKDNNWEWGENDAVFRSNQNQALVTISLSRATKDYASVRYDVAYWNGETHYQAYSNIAVSDFVNFRFFTENSYAVVYEFENVKGEDPEPAVDPTPEGVKGYVSAYPYYVYNEALDLDVIGTPKKINFVADNGDVTAVTATDFSFTAGQQIAASEGNQTFAATYKGETVSVTIPVIMGAEAFGSTTLTTVNWYDSWQPTGHDVPAGTSLTKHYFVYSKCGENFHGPYAHVNDSEWKGLTVFRWDNWGWNDDGSTAWNNIDDNKESNWNWDTMTANQNHCLTDITWTNVGGTTATVRYDVIYWNGEKHYQLYKNVTINGGICANAAADCCYVVVLK